MPDHAIDSISTRDARFPLPPGAGTDSVHTNPEYCLAVTLLASGNLCGTGIVLTLGEGNRLVCETIELLAKPLAGLPIEELMADFGRRSRMLADDPCLRWLGPHKGVVHLALASITNALMAEFYFDEHSGLLLRMLRYSDSPLGRNPTQVDYSDYRDDGKVKVPFQRTISTPRSRYSIRIERVQDNVPIDEKIFLRPATDPVPGNSLSR